MISIRVSASNEKESAHLRPIALRDWFSFLALLPGSQATCEPSIDFRGWELAELADRGRGQALPGDPQVNPVQTDPKIFCDFVHG
jgi:hypothetical protein